MSIPEKEPSFFSVFSEWYYLSCYAKKIENMKENLENLNVHSQGFTSRVGQGS